MSPEATTLFEATTIGGVILIGYLIWVGVRRALGVLGYSAADRVLPLVVAGAFVGAWLALAIWLGASGFFHGTNAEAVPKVVFGLGVPLAVALAILATSERARDIVAATPQHLLIGVQLYRLEGAVFLIMLAYGRLPGEFAIPAGWGDVLIGASAPIVAWLYRRDATRWRGLAVLWNVVGLIDLIVAVGMGVLTAPGRLQQLALDAPNSLITAFPLVLIPTFLVPMSILLHLLSLRRLTSGRARPIQRVAAQSLCVLSLLVLSSELAAQEPLPTPSTPPPTVAVGSSAPAADADVVVVVTGIRSAAGEVGCALFPNARGFPLDLSGAVQQWHAVQLSGVTCRFEGVKPGTYAVAVTHDLNGNHRTDRNFFGIPTEDWGVSNDVRPRMRPPRFEEAAFKVTDGAPVRLTIRVTP
jgi:uncharacterized protein (DUF2141 family)